MYKERRNTNKRCVIKCICWISYIALYKSILSFSSKKIIETKSNLFFLVISTFLRIYSYAHFGPSLFCFKFVHVFILKWTGQKRAVEWHEIYHQVRNIYFQIRSTEKGHMVCYLSFVRHPVRSVPRHITHVDNELPGQDLTPSLSAILWLILLLLWKHEGNVVHNDRVWQWIPRWTMTLTVATISHGLSRSPCLSILNWLIAVQTFTDGVVIDVEKKCLPL